LALIPNGVVSDTRFKSYNKYSFKGIKRGKAGVGSTLYKMTNSKKRSKIGLMNNDIINSDRKPKFLDSNPYARSISK